MSLVDHLFAIGFVRKAIWKFWYPYLTRKVSTEEVLFLNYAFESDPPVGLALSADDEPNRGCIQLYHHVATQVDLRGKTVLEVSCGHGGGASFLTRTLQPASYVGLDLNAKGIRFCRERHRVPGLSFVQGDAESLPFPDSSFDAVINVEASHCYPNFPRFLSEVARVLRPGGHFLYTDFRFNDGVVSGKFSEWERMIAAAPLRLRQQRVINDEVRRGLDLNSRRSLSLVTRLLPKYLHDIGRDFAGIPGSRAYNAMKDGELSYRSFCFVKN